jgi:hypothetical protein
MEGEAMPIALRLFRRPVTTPIEDSRNGATMGNTATTA